LVKKLTIGSVTLPNPLIQAPMAGVTDSVCRRIAKKYGAGMVCAEFVSSKGLVQNHKKTQRMLYFHPEERPISFQLFGCEPDVMADAAKMVEDSGADIIDINFGCPVTKAVKGYYGVALMREPGLVKDIVSTVVKAVSTPVTVKMRSGWDQTSRNYLEIGKISEEAGIKALTLHPRTKSQGFSGNADWNQITELAEHVSVPVIGSGDVLTPENAVYMLENTGATGVMFGRGAWGNPWIFSRTISLLETGHLPAEPDIDDKMDVLLQHFEGLCERYGHESGVKIIRKHAHQYVKGIRNSTTFKQEINRAGSREEVKKLILEFRENTKINSAGAEPDILKT
jgi:tRNA-dihydrouridine synthase B